MKRSEYSPDDYMSSLYDDLRNEPYKSAKTEDDCVQVGNEIKEKAKKLFLIDKICDLTASSEMIKQDTFIEYNTYTLQKYSLKINDYLISAVYMLTPKNVQVKPTGVVALCGHGYGVRQILNISKSGKKKHFNYFDNYQNNFAVELVKRGAVVIAPELFGFGEARLSHDLYKPFYISSCDELSHHLLPYGLTTASVRIAQALMCAKVLRETDIVDSDKISIMGISGGGLTALYTSVLDDTIYKTVICGYINTFKDSILSMWHCPDNYIPGILEIGEIYDFASALSPKKLLIESGKNDKLFPIAASELAHNKIKDVYRKMNAESNLVIDVFNGKHKVNGHKSFDWITE